ncbi:MAG: alkaline phosphatase [Pseudonocardia sp.]
MGRRAVLRAAALLPLAGCAPVLDPFTLGVASGDPTPDGVVLWTRLATDPLAPDGLGGIGTRRTEVQWQVAEDERFARVVASGTATTGPEQGHAVHVEVAGLSAGREYSYRFRAGGALSPAGRTRTTPAPGSLSPLTVCVASCAQYEHGFYTAYRRIAQDAPDLVLHLGDYIYEEAPGAYRVASGSVRWHTAGEARTLADYRLRHAQYRADPDLQAAHAAAPWLAGYDDHEVADDWAGDRPALPDPDFPARRSAALRAYRENLPLRPSPVLYRRISWGALATVHLLDTRRYRTPGDLLGPAQERWLTDGLAASSARWDVLAQQVFFARLAEPTGPGNPDAWDGFPASRDRIADALAGVRNGVVLTGDVHSCWAADVHRRWDAAAPVVASEIVTTSISSGGDGSEVASPLLALNPHVRYFADRRGHVRARFTPTEVRVEFRTLPYVSRPGAPVATAAAFAVADGRPGPRPV